MGKGITRLGGGTYPFQNAYSPGQNMDEEETDDSENIDIFAGELRTQGNTTNSVQTEVDAVNPPQNNVARQAEGTGSSSSAVWNRNEHPQQEAPNNLREERWKEDWEETHWFDGWDWQEKVLEVQRRPSCITDIAPL